MNHKIALCAAGLSILPIEALAQSATAGSGIYFGVITGPEIIAGGADAFDYNTGYVVGAQAGLRFGQWRAQGELAYGESEFRDIDNDVFDIDIIRGNVSLLYDLPTTPAVDALSPFVGGGLGVSNIETTGDGFKDDDTGLTLHGEVGMAIAITQSTSLVPQYRYEWFEQGVAGFDDYFHSHSFRIGAQVGF